MIEACDILKSIDNSSITLINLNLTMDSFIYDDKYYITHASHFTLTQTTR
ncbi:hypothetical protein MNB_SV-6-1702 [hydrothermal vent metagenome]|uniref:Uncharacterized protein n=1 Tax=hydrothermal vent metagenome TaxID=652676 RepID=A0A1W1BM75_9ZZZZ